MMEEEFFIKRRHTLISSVLEALPTYFLSVFRLLIGQALKVEKLMSRFLWEKYDNGKMAALFAWKEVSHPNESRDTRNWQYDGKKQGTDIKMVVALLKGTKLIMGQSHQK
ncbi:hypothetical protein Scep_016214 [Stephania cephalantha]|uniref:Uncharacterized protein n=1 Tax=Stephania cephalantha TaxID=152367 RepID=A0AAP0NVK2_9MAGN